MNHRPGFDAVRGLLVALCCTTLAVACSGGGKSTGGSGGAPGGTGSGGAVGAGTGGAAPGSGGASAAGSGGISGSGGASAPASGGAAGSGNMGSGGTGNGSGGAAVATGGASGAGGHPGGSGGATAGGGTAGGTWSSTFPMFTKHTIASFSSGYMTVVADVDHDGLPDVVALSSGSDGLVWFKNPSWKKYTITTRAKQLIYAAPYDIDGDGDLDLAVASDFSMTDTTGGGTVSWAENPADPTQSQDWTLHPIGAVPTSHRLRWGDIDGDGKKELIDLPIFGEGSTAPAYAGAVQLTAFFIPANPKDASATWMSQVIDNKHLEVAHGIEIVDWDGDKAEDILTAANDGVDLFRVSLGLGEEHLGAGEDGTAPSRGSSEVALGSLAGARFIATIEPWHGTDAVVYTPGATPSDLWMRQVLGTDFEHGHGLAAADFNGDGYDEIVGGGGQGMMTQMIYRYQPSTGKWDKIPLDVGGVAVSGMDVKDLNGDGALDIVSIGTSPTNNVVWYENMR